LPVIGRVAGRDYAAVDGEDVGGMDVRKGLNNFGSEYAVSEDGGGKGQWRNSENDGIW